MSLTLCALIALTQGASTPTGFGMSPPQFWRSPFGQSPWTPLAGDADGDGRADLLAIGPAGESRIEIAKTAPIGKPYLSNVARNSMGKGLVASACGTFIPGSKAADVMAVYEDGSVHVAWGMPAGGDAYTHDDVVCKLGPESIPKAPSRTAVADFDGDGTPDVLILDQEGKMVLIRVPLGQDGRAYFRTHLLSAPLLGVRQFAAGTLSSDKRGQAVWMDEAGAVWRATVDAAQDGSAAIGQPTSIAHASVEDHLAVGRFKGAKTADVLVGQRLYTGGEPGGALTMSDIPPSSITRDDEAWVVADIDGNGKDDLIRHCRLKQQFGADDVYIHFSYDSSDPAKGYYCSANDGLLDIWKLGKMKPGGIDLASLGCKVGHRDIVIEIERFDNEPFDRLKANMDRVVKYFASLPLVNPDGTTGIAVHMTYSTPWPIAQKDEIWKKFDDIFPPKAHRGVVHTVFCASGGPLVSKICGDRGHSNEGWKEFLHEFGHQLNLNHEGFHPNLSGLPNDSGGSIYPSLMSYSYSYSVDGDGEKVGYSNGALASVQFDMRHLSETLPFPMEKVHFLSQPPYSYRMKPSDDGQSTLIDWNWNGVLGEENVSADIAHVDGIDPGPLWKVAKADTGSALVVHGDRPLIVYGQSAAVGVRTWIGTNRDTEGPKWSAEEADANAGLTGDPTAAYLDNITWIAYPTAKGAVLRPVSLDGSGRPSLGSPNLVPGTEGAQPTVAAVDGRLVLLIWRNKTSKIGIRMIAANGTQLSAEGERQLDIVSDVPVGATPGPSGCLWVGRIQPDGLDHGGKTEVLRIDLSENKVAYRSWIGGEYARHRMGLLWRPEAGNLPEGRIYMISGGTGAQPERQQFLTINTGYPEVSEGWRFRRIEIPEFTSASAPGACFFQGDILSAFRRPGDDAVNVAFYTTGATPRPLGDFDDIGHIRDYGLSRSINEVPK